MIDMKKKITFETARCIMIFVMAVVMVVSAFVMLNINLATSPIPKQKHGIVTEMHKEVTIGERNVEYCVTVDYGKDGLVSHRSYDTRDYYNLSVGDQCNINNEILMRVGWVVMWIFGTMIMIGCGLFIIGLAYIP